MRRQGFPVLPLQRQPHGRSGENPEADGQYVRSGESALLREFQLRRLLRGGPQAVRPRPAEHLCADDRQHGVVERSGHQRVEGNRHRRDADRREDQRQERGHGDRQVRRRRLFVRTGPDHVRRLQRQKGDGESGRTRGQLCGRRLEQQTGGFRT